MRKKKEVESKVSELTIKDGNQMFCGVCNLSFDRKGRNVSQRFKSHVEGHLDLKHPCPYCSLVCTRTNNLRLHKKKSASTGFGIHQLAQYWLFHVDLPEFLGPGSQFRVPHDIILTDLKPDVLLIS